VLLEKRARRRFLDDVLEVDFDAVLLQKTSGVEAGRSGGLAVEDGPGHRLILLWYRSEPVREGLAPRVDAQDYTRAQGLRGRREVTVDYNTGEC
jgi:hypothetical protein